MSVSPEAVDMWTTLQDAPRISITWRAGRVHVHNGQRVLVVRHESEASKPVLRILGPAFKHEWTQSSKRSRCDYCRRCRMPRYPLRSEFCADDYQQP